MVPMLSALLELFLIIFPEFFLNVIIFHFPKLVLINLKVFEVICVFVLISEYSAKQQLDCVRTYNFQNNNNNCNLSQRQYITNN